MTAQPKPQTTTIQIRGIYTDDVDRLRRLVGARRITYAEGVGRLLDLFELAPLDLREAVALDQVIS